MAYLVIPVVRGKIRVKRALATPAGAQTILINQMIIRHFFHLKQLKLYLCNQKQQHIYLIFYT